MGEIKEDDDNEVVDQAIAANPLSDFFFIDWKGKFVRVDLEQIREVKISERQMTIFMQEEAVYDVRMGEEQIEELTLKMTVPGVKFSRIEVGHSVL